MKQVTFLSILLVLMFTQAFSQTNSIQKSTPMTNKKDHYTFQLSDKVTRQKVTFENRYGILLSADLYLPKDSINKVLAAIAISGPFGAVKEQSSGLYANTMAERGFAALALDPSYTGESGGEPRNIASPDINTEDFSAAVDFLGTRPFVDRGRIGVLGICGSGGFVISAAKIDPRMKAIATVSMYDMGGANRHALQRSLTLEQRKKIIADAAEQRYVEFTGGDTKYRRNGSRVEREDSSHSAGVL